MPVAEIITIGTEILLGEIIDTNAQFIARKLRDAGIDLYRKTTVGDNTSRIADAIRQALQRCDIVITTGGLGPTVDDPTREAVAEAMDLEIEYRPELWDQIQSRFQRFGRLPTENNMRQAFVPAGATAITNPVGTAPAFIVNSGHCSVISLPGVPREMEYLLEQEVLPYLEMRFKNSGVIKARTLHTVGIGESQIDDLIGDLEKMSNPTVGLAAHTGQVDVRITAKAATVSEADLLISEIEGEIHQRLGDWIYGADQDSLVEIALDALRRKGWSLAVIEAGSDGELIRLLSATNEAISPAEAPVFQGGDILQVLPAENEFLQVIKDYRKNHQVDVCLGVSIQPETERQVIHLVLMTPVSEITLTRPYGGPASYAPRWAIHHSLDLLRRL